MGPDDNPSLDVLHGQLSAKDKALMGTIATYETALGQLQTTAPQRPGCAYWLERQFGTPNDLRTTLKESAHPNGYNAKPLSPEADIRMGEFTSAQLVFFNRTSAAQANLKANYLPQARGRYEQDAQAWQQAGRPNFTERSDLKSLVIIDYIDSRDKYYALIRAMSELGAYQAVTGNSDQIRKHYPQEAAQARQSLDVLKARGENDLATYLDARYFRAIVDAKPPNVGLDISNAQKDNTNLLIQSRVAARIIDSAAADPNSIPTLLSADISQLRQTIHILNRNGQANSQEASAAANHLRLAQQAAQLIPPQLIRI